MKRRRDAAIGEGTSIALDIVSLGARGDGIARHDGTEIYVPFTVPGDRILARLAHGRGEGRAASIEKLLVPGPGRGAASCRHFGTCGGCALQHLDVGLYAATKLELVRSALARQGFVDAPVASVQLLPPGTRRRIRLSLERPLRRAAAVRVGFAERESHAIVDLTECAVMHPRLFAIVAPLRAFAADLLLPGEAGHATMQLVDSGIDLLLDVPRVPHLAALEALAAFAAAQDLARLVWRGPDGGEKVPVAQRRPVQIILAGVAVDVPVDGFLQATREAEIALTAAVLAGVSGATHIADLFAGIGTFAFALSALGRVHAVEGWPPASGALRAAANRAGCSHRVTVEARDLEERPLEPDELAAYDAVVFDPPRIGAKAQAAALARSTVPCIVAVSCNPASFARDARILAAGGYRMISVQPIDQFIWSSHIELVAVFRRN
jgi:23S rRNA (uracil1939-C5)-methyltransferase